MDLIREANRWINENDNSYIDKYLKMFNVPVHDKDGKKFVVLWHGTKKGNLSKIYKSGKIKSGTYFTQDEDIARRYARMTGNSPVASIFEIDKDALGWDGHYFYLTRDVKYTTQGWI